MQPSRRRACALTQPYLRRSGSTLRWKCCGNGFQVGGKRPGKQLARPAPGPWAAGIHFGKGAPCFHPAAQVPQAPWQHLSAAAAATPPAVPFPVNNQPSRLPNSLSPSTGRTPRLHNPLSLSGTRQGNPANTLNATIPCPSNQHRKCHTASLQQPTASWCWCWKVEGRAGTGHGCSTFAQRLAGRRVGGEDLCAHGTV